MASELLRVGTIAGVFGLKGELKCDPTAAGEPLFVAGATFHARPHECELEIASVREHKGRLLIRLVQARDINEAERFVGTILLAPRERVDALLDPEEVLDVDLIGTTVSDRAGRALGEVVDVEHYPSSSMLIVGPNRVLVPFVKAYLLSFDRAARRMTLDVPTGLFDDDFA